MDGYWGYNSMNNGNGVWGFAFMILMMAFVITGVILVILYIGRQSHKQSGKVALDILEKRFANGEIDTKEFEAKRKILSE